MTLRVLRGSAAIVLVVSACASSSSDGSVSGDTAAPTDDAVSVDDVSVGEDAASDDARAGDTTADVGVDGGPDDVASPEDTGPVDDVMASEDSSATDPDGGTPDTSGDTVDPAPLAVTGVTPRVLVRSVGGAITITGQGFVSGTTVGVGGLPCTDLAVVSETEITCVAPVHTTACGATDVTVTRPDAVTYATLEGGVVYRAAAPVFRSSSLAFDAGAGASALVVVDLDGDGHLDILTAATDADTVVFNRGDGDGGFVGQEPIAIGAGSPRALAVANVAGDSRLDVITLNGDTPASVTVSTPDSGTFMATVSPITVENFAAGRALAVGEFNGDGHVDLVVGQEASLYALPLMGDGNGAFTGTTTRALGGEPAALVLTDMNGDGLDDLVSSNTPTNSVSVCLVKDGAFGNPLNVTVGQRPQGMVLADHDGQAPLDVVVVNRDESRVSVLDSDGAGGFKAPQTVDLPGLTMPTAAAAADLDADGDLDVITAGPSTLGFAVNLGDGATLTDMTLWDVALYPRALAVGDVDEDGLLDIVYLGTADNLSYAAQRCE